MSQVANSRHGLVPCPRCQVHIKAEDLQSGCPFCPTSTTSSKQRLRRLGLNSRWAKGALVAATMTGMTALFTSCAAQPAYGAPAPESTVEQSTEPSADAGPQPAYGIPAEMGPSDAGSADTAPAPAYGIPAESGNTDAGSADMTPAPAYGMPAPDQP